MPDPETVADLLGSALQRLHAVADPVEREQLSRLQERVAVRRLRVLVVGEAKRGKSTLINRLLGRDLLPTGVAPVTAVATTVRADHGQPEVVNLRFIDGSQLAVPPAELGNYVTESNNPDNVCRVLDVEVVCRSPLLENHDLELVDTPGTGSVFEHNTEAAKAAIRSLDAAIFVLTATPPISRTERELLANVVDASVRTFVVLNKVDQLRDDELEEAYTFASRVVGKVDSTLDVVPITALRGPGDPGFARFAEAFTTYLDKHGSHDADRALAMHVRTHAQALADQASMANRLLDLAEADNAEKLDRFEQRLDDLAARYDQLDEQCWAFARRQLRQLNESARITITASTSAVCDEVNAELADRAELASADDVEAAGRDLLARLITPRVEAWRQDQAAELDTAFRSMVGSAETELAELLDGLRDAAHEILDLEITMLSNELLKENREFWYDYRQSYGWELPFAGAVRRLANRSPRRARARLLNIVPELVDRQVGRARADVQSRLDAALRTVSAQLHQSYRLGVGAVRDQLVLIRAVQTGSTEQRSNERALIQARMATTLAVLDDLDHLAVTSVSEVIARSEGCLRGRRGHKDLPDCRPN
jgi:small GTP-binding protein